MTGAPEPEVATPQAGPKPSGAARLLWWCVTVMPIAAGPLIIMLAPLFLLGAGAAFIVVVDAVTDRGVPARQRALAILLAAAVIPGALLAMVITGPMMSNVPTPRRPLWEWLLLLGAVAVWVLLFVQLKPKVWQITKKSEWKP
jgi:hypothetical protein